MVKHIDIDENIEFCDMLNSVNTITSEFLPYYFKKGNKILEYLINEIDNNFDEEWFDFDKIDEVTGKDNPHLGKNELSLCYLRNLPSSLINDFIKLKENSKRFAEKNGYFTIHLSNWWIYRYDKIFISYNTDLFNLYKDSLKPKDNDTYFLVILNDKFAWRHNDKFFRTIGEWYKDYIIKNIKYEIFKHPEFKNKFIDAECILGDLDNITEKDWEIEI
jgi:hypothetical protein